MYSYVMNTKKISIIGVLVLVGVLVLAQAGLVPISHQSVAIETAHYRPHHHTIQTAQAAIPISTVLVGAANKVDPAVVSIIISKNVPQVGITYEHLTFNDPLFKSFDVAIPVFTQTGQLTKQPVGVGSGIIISHNGYILTNNHVVADSSASYTAMLADGTEVSATVVYQNPQLDAAIVKIDGNYPTIATFGNSSTLHLDEPIAAIGNAYGSQANSVSIGVISGFNRHIIANNPEGGSEDLQGLISTNANIAPGYSGGPLIDTAGNVIGLNVAKDTESPTSFSIPINTLRSIINPYTTA